MKLFKKELYIYLFLLDFKKVLMCVFKFLGTSVLNPGAGFLRIFTVAFDRLFYVRLVKGL